jgi:hypothetical protein
MNIVTFGIGTYRGFAKAPPLPFVNCVVIGS